METSVTWFDRLHLILRYRRFLMIWILVWILAGIVISFVIPTRYRARASFLPPVEEGGGMLAIFGQSMSMGRTSDIESGGFNAILKSRRLKDSINTRFDLKKHFKVEKLDQAYDNFDAVVDFSTESELGLGLARIHAFYVRVDDKDPKTAADMANAIVFYTDRITAELTNQRARISREFLESRVASAKDSLRRAEDSLTAFSARTGIVAPEAQVEATIKALGQVKEQIVANEIQIQVLRSTLGSNHHSVKEAEVRLQALIRQSETLSGDLDRPAANSDLIGLKKSPEMSIRYFRLFREVKIGETLVSFLTQQLEQARIAELRNAPVLRILDQAAVPDVKKWPIRSLVTVLVTLLGLFSGLLWIGWKEWLAAIKNTEFEQKVQEILVMIKPSHLLKTLLGKEQ